MAEEAHFQQFSKHIPNILRRQIINSNICQYIGEKSETTLNPTMQRFDCSLLFVDISGFTNLSQLLPVEELRRQINSYFERILSIVGAYNGEVIKFAGDALFIIWQTGQSEKEDNKSQSMKAAVDCGLEIAHHCSNYKITISQHSKKSPRGIDGSAPESYVYLNVHIGASYGLMAGLDIGFNNRWEYVLLGSPMNDVAIAEGDATTGELVISPIAHELIHSSCNDASCGCQITKSNYFKVSPSSLQSVKWSADLLEEQHHSSILFGIQNFSEIVDDMMLAFDFTKKSTLVQEYGPLIQQKAKELCLSSSSNDDTNNNTDNNNTENNNNMDTTGYLDHYLEWMHHALLDDLASHAHRVVREKYKLHTKDRIMTLSNIVRNYKDGDNSSIAEHNSSSNGARFRDSRSSSQSSTQSSSSSSPMSSMYAFRDSVMIRMRGGSNSSLREESKRKHSQVLQDDSALSSELRNVITMFINIKMPSASELHVDDQPEQERIYEVCEKEFNFLPRTTNERARDMAMLSLFQSSITVINTEVEKYHGQLRQYIVDDKGTVCIGTFGLRGSVNYDNAAAAVKCALSIQSKLKSVCDIDTSVGLSSGKVYCGLVGSKYRHEYAVMGPSVNLSARLMAKGAFGELTCDAITHDRDRSHQYRFLGAIKAKGYANPVPTYQPIAENIVTGAGTSTCMTAVQDVINSLSSLAPMNGRARDGYLVFRSALQFNDGICSDFDTTYEAFFNATNIQLELDKFTPTSSNVINIDTPSRLIVITGDHGVGKTYFMNRLDEKLFAMLLSGKFNLIPIKRKSGAYNSTDPLSGWICMITQVCFNMMLHYLATENLTDEERSKINPYPETTPEFFACGNCGFHYVCTKMDSNIVKYQHLILGILPMLECKLGCKDTIATLTKEERVQKLIEFLVAFFTTASSLSKKQLVLSLDDAEDLDESSRELVYRLWSTTKGFSFIVTAKNDPFNNNNASNNNIYDAGTNMFSRYVNSDRFFRVQLNPLGEDAFAILTQKVFKDSDILDISTELCTTIGAGIYKNSGGNPLIASELLHVLVDKFRTMTDVSLQDINGVAEALKDISTARIDELICFRFDNLSFECQLVLKVLSVIVSSGCWATFDALDFTTRDLGILSPLSSVFNAQLESGTELKVGAIGIDLPSILNILIYQGEFLHPVRDIGIRFLQQDNKSVFNVDNNNVDCTLNSDKDLTTSRIPVDVLKCLLYTFKVELEFRTIYSLMLEEQKESLHDRVANYMEQLIGKSEDNFTGKNLMCCAFHWERAGVYTTAMEYYYKAAQQLGYEGEVIQARKAIFNANKMLSTLFKNAGVARHQEDVVAVGTFRSVQQKIKDDNTNNNDGSLSPRRSPRIKPITQEELFRIFNGDITLLSLGIKVIVGQVAALLQCCNEIQIISRFLDEALLYISLIIDNKKTSSSFMISDYTSFASILTKIFSFYASGKIVDSVDYAKHNRVHDLLSTLSVKYSNNKEALHFKIVDIAHYIMLLINQQNTTEILSQLQQLLSVYDHYEHANVLINIYGADLVPRTLYLAVQYFYHIKDEENYNKYSETLDKLIQQHTHLYSLTLGCIGYITFLNTIVGNNDKAVTIFQQFKQQEEKDLSNCHFKTLAKIIDCSLKQSKCYKLYQETKAIANDWQPAEGEIVKFLQDKEVIIELDNKMSELYSIGLQGICAQYCYHEYVLNNNNNNTNNNINSTSTTTSQESLIKWLEDGLQFVNNAIELLANNKIITIGSMSLLSLKEDILRQMNEKQNKTN